MKKLITLLITFVLLFALAACSTGSAATSTGTDGTQSQTSTSVEATVAGSGAESVTEAQAENSETHEDANDYTWDAATVVAITLNGDSITADGNGVTVNGSTATITSAGTYSLSGSLADGQIVVDTQDEDIVRLILNGVSLNNSTSAPLNIVNAEETILALADNTQNTITDGSAYVFANAEEDEPNAAIFSKSDLTIYGSGALTVNGNYNDGIASKDGLIIASGAITVNAADDGIRGKDYLVIEGGSLTVNARGDGLKSDNEEDAALGYISIVSGTFNVTAGGDAITAQTDVLITDGSFTLSSGGGSSVQVSEETSAKGIKAAVNVNIENGSFVIDSADDAIHSNGSIAVNGGTFSLASADDGMHADAALEINGGDIQVTRSYEGLESAVITINAGSIHVKASDDGINVAGGVDSSGMRPGGGPGQESFASATNYYLYIHGGTLVVDADGDGLDANGAIEMTGGVVLVNGPTQQMNGALDYDAGFVMSGGLIVATGSAGMAQAPGANSSQNSLLVYLDSMQAAGTLIHIQDSTGRDILTFAPGKDYQSIAFSSPDLVQGGSYEVYLGGSSTGTVTDGLYQGGTYTPGTLLTNFTASSVVTTIGSGGGGRPGRP